MAISRRKFLATVGTTGAAVTIVPRHVLGRGLTPPSDRLNIAGVGVGGMGKVNLLNLGVDNNIVALCDVDWDHAGRAWDTLPADLAREEKRLPTVTTEEARRNSNTRIASLKRIIADDLPRVRRHRDYRRMFEEQKDIDAVVVATPDHLHAVIAMA